MDERGVADVQGAEGGLEVLTGMERAVIDGSDDVAGVQAGFCPAAIGVGDTDAQAGVISEHVGIDAGVGERMALGVSREGLVVLNAETEEMEVSSKIDGFAFVEIVEEEGVGGIAFANGGSG